MNCHCLICETPRYKDQKTCDTCFQRFSEVFESHKKHIVYDRDKKDIQVLCTFCYIGFLNKQAWS